MAKINGDRFYDFVDSEVQCLFYHAAIKTEALNTFTLAIFLWVATDPQMIQASKEHQKILLSRTLSGRRIQRSNAVECKILMHCEMPTS
jgi:hypothetical protein